MRANRVGFRRNRAQLRPQGLDVGVDGAVAAAERIAPHAVHQLRARQHRAGALEQCRKEAVLVASQVQEPPAITDTVAIGIVLETRHVCRLAGGGCAPASQHDAHARTSSRGENGFAT